MSAMVFFQPHEPQYHQEAKGSDKSHFCPEHLLPVVQAMCRASSTEQAQSLAQAYWQVAQNDTSQFQQRDCCGEPEAFEQKIGHMLGEYIVGPKNRKADGDAFVSDIGASIPHWAVLSLLHSHVDGFAQFDRLLVRVRDQVAPHKDDIWTQAFINEVVVSALRSYFSATLASVSTDNQCRRATEALHYIEEFASWRGAQPATLVINQIDDDLKASGYTSLSGLRDTLSDEDKRLVIAGMHAKRDSYALLDNPEHLPLPKRIERMLGVTTNEAAYVAMFNSRSHNLCRLIGTPKKLIEVTNIINELNMDETKARMARLSLGKTVVHAANVIALWNAHMTNEDPAEIGVAITDMPFGMPA